MDYPKETGKRIRAARKRMEWALDDLAERTGRKLLPSRISNYEQGTRLPGPHEAVILANALQESAAYLMCLDEGGDMSVEEAELLRNWRALPERDRKDYARRISALAMAYREAVPDEKLTGWKAPAVKIHDPHKKKPRVK